MQRIELFAVLYWMREHPVISVSLALFALFLKQAFWNFYFSHLSHLPGPPRAHFLHGHQRVLLQESDLGRKLADYIARYGSVIRISSPLFKSRIVLADEKAINYVLQVKPYEYEKPKSQRAELELLVGKGLLTATGQTHKLHRRLLVPALTSSKINSYGSLLFLQSSKLVDQWRILTRESPAIVDVAPWYSKIAFDIIAKCGFGQSYNTIEGEVDDFVSVVSKLTAGKPLQVTLAGTLLTPLLLRFPRLIRRLPLERPKKLQRALDLLRKKFDAFYQDRLSAIDDGDDTNEDLLSLLIKANRDEDEKHRLTEAEIRDTSALLLLAGSETSAVTLCWCTLFLAQNPDVQEQVRQEVLKVKSGAEAAGLQVTIQELFDLPRLSSFIKEVLRLQPAFATVLRETSRDDIIPLSSPLPNGSMFLKVKKGDALSIALFAANCHTNFESDSYAFRPARWLSQDSEIEAGKKGLPYGNLYSFLCGPRQCLGYRLAVAEMSAVLFSVLAQFRFREATSHHPVARTDMVSRPYVDGQFDKPRSPVIIEAL